MVETVATASVTGLDVCRVRVEVSITRGTPMIQIVGLPQGAVREGRERIRAAVAQLGLHVPGLRITVNLAPAGVPKHGAAFDLPITVGILAAAGDIPGSRTRRFGLVGELGLDGSVRAIRGALPIAIHASRERDLDGWILPHDNLRETGSVSGIDIRGAAHLGAVLAFLRGEGDLPTAHDLPPVPAPVDTADADLSEIRGQPLAKRVLEIAAAGGHNVLLRGSPGAGKTTLARAVPTILPPMSTAEAIEVTAVHSVAGRLPVDSGLLGRRPFRAPHHTISDAGLIGGGSPPRPGEVSLAHRGVLFLDELPEFGRRPLESLRQPLEEGCVHVVRVHAAATFPARFLLAAAMNPCPCGYLNETEHVCTCDPGAVLRYRSRISGPLLDRFDMRIDVPRLAWKELYGDRASESSAIVRDRVCEARERAGARLRAEGVAALTNAEMEPRSVRRCCRTDAASRRLLERAVDGNGLTARGYFRVLRLARTIADLAGRGPITAEDLQEAIRYRGVMRGARGV